MQDIGADVVVTAKVGTEVSATRLKKALLGPSMEPTTISSLVPVRAESLNNQRAYNSLSRIVITQCPSISCYRLLDLSTPLLNLVTDYGS